MDSHERTTSVKSRARELGFLDVGIADLGRNKHEEYLLRWLSTGMAGTMAYMHRQAARRIEPSRILPGADRAIVLMRNHFTIDPPMSAGTGRVAKYARGPDYHDTLREPLQELVAHVLQLGDRNTIAQAYVDAGPVPERELAQRAGLGWIGRNTMLIHPRYGSHLFLAVVLTNLGLALDLPFSHDRCGSCNRCIEACPTGAIKQGRMIDSRLCISYLTIEHAGEIDEKLQRFMGDRIFGCDECQNVCPWNAKFSTACDDPKLSLVAEKAQESLVDLLAMGPNRFLQRFGHTPLKRAGVEGLKRNARIAMSNSSFFSSD